MIAQIAMIYSTFSRVGTYLKKGRSRTYRIEPRRFYGINTWLHIYLLINKPAKRAIGSAISNIGMLKMGSNIIWKAKRVAIMLR